MIIGPTGFSMILEDLVSLDCSPEGTEMNWDWGAVAQSILGAGLGSAGFQAFINWRRDTTQKKERGTFLALRLSVLLEAFAYECAELIRENQSASRDPGREFPNWNGTLPKPASYPEDVDGWRSLPQELASAALDLINDRAGAQSIIFLTADLREQKTLDQIIFQAATLGLDAWATARRLRVEFRIPESEPAWPFMDYMERELKEAEKRLE